MGEARYLVADQHGARCGLRIKNIMPEPVSAASHSDRLATVNGLRGVAILLVMYSHWNGWFIRLPFFPDSAIPLGALQRIGVSGVDLFFILSGFVLFLPYADGRRSLRSIADARNFYRRRLFRLLPAYYFCAVTLMMITYVKSDPPWLIGDSLRVLSFSFVFSRYNFSPSLNGPFWSLGVEGLFSLAFPFLVIAAGRIGLRRLLMLAIILCLSVRVVGYLWNPSTIKPNIISDNISGRLDQFMLGMVIARYYARGLIGERSRYFFFPGLILAAAACAGLYLQNTPFGYTWWDAVLRLVLSLGFSLVLLAALAGSGRLVRLLSSPPLQVAGMMCYSLYLWHRPLREWAEIWTPGMPPSITFAVWLVPLAVVGAFSYRFIEFGHVRDWRPLFLWRAEPVPVPAVKPGI